ncbi:hypothetical protein XELAEV_18039362mg [Xenopus laevis]|uniref:Uncharacterized protein n=1 Tax=Xenopus laevis TaxID=8355 RepID=A0A974C7M6_XENLA|nr:hypothetical protein XELAEV_18039362mg [Xenopus laevis]
MTGGHEHKKSSSSAGQSQGREHNLPLGSCIENPCWDDLETPGRLLLKHRGQPGDGQRVGYCCHVWDEPGLTAPLMEWHTVVPCLGMHFELTVRPCLCIQENDSNLLHWKYMEDTILLDLKMTVGCGGEEWPVFNTCNGFGAYTRGLC